MEETEEFKRLKRHFKKKEQKDDEIILEQILKELKQKHDRERQEKIDSLNKEINILKKY